VQALTCCFFKKGSHFKYRRYSIFERQQRNVPHNQSEDIINLSLATLHYSRTAFLAGKFESLLNDGDGIMWFFTGGAAGKE